MSALAVRVVAEEARGCGSVHGAAPCWTQHHGSPRGQASSMMRKRRCGYRGEREGAHPGAPSGTTGYFLCYSCREKVGKASCPHEKRRRPRGAPSTLGGQLGVGQGGAGESRVERRFELSLQLGGGHRRGRREAFDWRTDADAAERAPLTAIPGAALKRCSDGGSGSVHRASSLGHRDGGFVEDGAD